MAVMIRSQGIGQRAKRSLNVTVSCYSSQPYIIKNPTTATLPRGTGGRSSFNGIICTVFGSTGFTGRYVCNRLGKIGTQIIIPYRGDIYPVYSMKLCGDLGQVLFHPFELYDEESIYRSVKHSNVVVNMIGSDWETRNFSFEDVHIRGARKIAKICREANVERLVHVSALNASPNPTPIINGKGSEFLKTKWEGECVVKEEFPTATIVRPASIVGQEDRFISYYTNRWRRMFGKVPLWQEGKETEKQPLHVNDFAAGIVAIVKDRKTAGKTYQFVGPNRYRLDNMVTWFHDQFKSDADEYGFSVIDIKKLPMFRLVIDANEITPFRIFRTLSWENFRREHTTDAIDKNLPTLEDLGIKPIPLEDIIAWEIKPHKLDAVYDATMENFAQIELYSLEDAAELKETK